MSTAARIDDLRKRFEDNPRRYFAPLANEYRKAGDLTQAIALCREHLPKQPGHMSGHIVFGQALYEAGLIGEARTVFESALALDPENLIALRHLGDIAKASGDASAARRWYERVLDADPRNDDIAAQLATLPVNVTPRSVWAVNAPSPAERGGPARPESDAELLDLTFTPATGSAPVAAAPEPDAAMRAVDFDAVNDAVKQSALDSEADGGGEVAGEDGEIVTGAASWDAAESSLGTPAHDVPEPLTYHHDDSNHESRSLSSGLKEFASAEGEAINEILEPAFSAPTAEHGSVDETVGVDGTSVASSAPDNTADVDQADSLEAPIPEPVALTAHDVSADTPIAHALDTFAAAVAPPGDGDVVDDSAAAPAEEFEEGFFAPEWPAAQALVAQITAPRAPTPRGVSIVHGASHEMHEAFERHADEPGRMERASDAVTAEVEPHEEMPPGRYTPVGTSAEPVDTTVQPIATAPDAVIETADSDVHDGAVVMEVEDVEDAPRDSDASPPISWESSEPSEATSPVAPAVAETPVRTQFDIGDETWTGAGAEGWTPAEPEDESSFADVMPEDVGVGIEGDTAFVTETMGELLVAQGFTSRAITVFEELVRRRPYDPVLQSRLEELRASHEAMPPEPPRGLGRSQQTASGEGSEHDRSTPETTGGVRSGAFPVIDNGTPAWSEAYEASGEDTGTELAGDQFEHAFLEDAFAASDASDDESFAYVHEDEWAASGQPLKRANADHPDEAGAPSLASAEQTPIGETSFADGDPQSDAEWDSRAAQPTPHSTERPSPRPSARELFAMLAIRRVVRRTPPASHPAVLPLRTEVSEPAPSFAPNLVGVGAATPGLEALFGKDAGPDDDSAARALADAFRPVGSHNDAATPFGLDFTSQSAALSEQGPDLYAGAAGIGSGSRGGSVEGASHGSTPVGSRAAPPAEQSNDFSFDRFFPDSAPRSAPTTDATASVASAAQPAPSGSASDDSATSSARDDLAHFSAWLKGLGQ